LTAVHSRSITVAAVLADAHASSFAAPERTLTMHDVIIIGGSYAGLAAALQLGRARRRVLIIDAGERRNRFVQHAHGFLTRDGQSPDSIAAAGRADVARYPTVSFRDGSVSAVRAIDGGFAVRAGDDEHTARRLILATGVVDELPAIPGLAERWGQSVYPCPYCDGYERNLGRLAVLATGPLSMHQAVLVSEWAAPGQTTFFLNGIFEPDAAQLATLAARGISIERTLVESAAGDAPTIELRLRDGRVHRADGLFLHPHTIIKDRFAEQLGCELDAGPLGAIYKIDPTRETTVPGVFACGDVGLGMPAVAYAVADGTRAGASAHQSLVFRP
jgi:thioredoxin reductase